jgi:hypothetical protein
MQIENREIFDQVVAYLEHHESSLRIKKMLYCLCTHRWERNQEFLQSINCYHFAEFVVREINTHEELKARLFEMLKTLNKPQEYVPIAKIIYSALGQIYPEFHRQYSSELNPSPAVAAQYSPAPAPTPASAKIEYDAFELRQNLMSYANPLRVKTILHMVMEPEEFLDPRKINQHLLDDLLASLIAKYKTLTEIETIMSEAVELLSDVEEYGKAATGLMQALVPLYSKKARVVGAVTV